MSVSCGANKKTEKMVFTKNTKKRGISTSLSYQNSIGSDVGSELLL